MDFGWTVSVHGKHSLAAAFRYGSREECEHVALRADSMGLTVVDGPRPLTEAEQLPAMTRLGKVSE